MERADGPRAFYLASSRLLCRWVANTTRAAAVFGAVPCVTGLNEPDKHTQLSVMFLFTIECQPAQSGAPVWQHGGILSFREHCVLWISCNLNH